MRNTTDPAPLPRSVLLDTSVVLRAFGGHPGDPRSAACAALVDACARGGVRMMIAAPTLAEILRGGTTRPMPNVQGLEVVAFDAQAARVVGEAFPAEVLKELATAAGVTLTYLKYDALIVACAKRHMADAFVCLDDAQRRLAERVGLRAAAPEDFAR